MSNQTLFLLPDDRGDALLSLYTARVPMSNVVEVGGQGNAVKVLILLVLLVNAIYCLYAMSNIACKCLYTD